MVNSLWFCDSLGRLSERLKVKNFRLDGERVFEDGWSFCSFIFKYLKIGFQ